MSHCYLQEELVKDSLPVSEEVKNAVKEMCPLIQYSYEVKDLINNSEPEVTTATRAMDVLLDSIVTESCDWVRVV